MQHRIFITTCNDIYMNLATEAFLMESCKDESYLFIWQNRPTVVIGRYQNPFIECNLQKMKEEGITLSRRFSGGGAVYHDMGNLCFTVIYPQDNLDNKRSFSVVLDALAECGIDASLSGRNDILVDGLKVSGSAFQIKNGKFCHHGTLLVDCDLSVMPRILTPSRKKLESHSIKSVSSRVSNLKAIRPDITVEKITEALVKSFHNVFSEGPSDENNNVENKVSIINDSFILNNSRIKEIYNQLSSYDWLIGNTPKFTDRLSGRTSAGDVVFQMNVEKAVITDVRIFSDNLNNRDVELLMKTLEGKKYDGKALIEESEKSDNTFVKESLMILAGEINSQEAMI